MINPAFAPTPKTTINISWKVFLPVYRHLVNNDADINFLWGGRDSGKSRHVAMEIVILCLVLPYFRCLLVRKVFDTIRESQYQTIKDIIHEWGLEQFFKFKVAPLSIECVNGNRIVAKGLDNQENVKSVKDPSHCWYEEGNQITLNDFITVTTTLRTNRVKIKQWMTFNPECEGDYEEFWLYKTFFSNVTENGTYTWQLQTYSGPINFTYTSTHTTYKDNKYATAQRIAFLEKLADIDPYYYLVYTMGKWGRRQNKAPFFYAFSREKHLKPTRYAPNAEVLLTFDFNRSPITAQAWQYYGGRLYGIKAFKLENSDIYKLCDAILDYFPGAVYIVTGDATGKNSTALVQNGINYYTVIKNKLRLSVTQIKVPTVNPPIKENQVLCNAVFVNIPVDIDPVEMRPLVFDLENVRLNPDGTIEKKDRKDPTQQADQADCFRYLCNTFFKWVLKQ